MNLKELAAEYGAKNLRFCVPMSKLEYAGIIPGIAFRSSNSPVEVVECLVNEDRYQVSEGYKITLEAVDPNFGKHHYYQMDLESILRSGPETHRIFVITSDGYTQIPNSVMNF